MVYEGSKTSVISFPLGGIGTGCVGLGGNGRLVDWEIFNRPNKGGTNGYSFMAVKAEHEGEVLDVRMLQSDMRPPYIGSPIERDEYRGFGFGPDIGTMAGFPHFDSARFVGEFPVARLDFEDADFPADVSLTAFNPFIPHNDKDSSIPVAMFEVSLANSTEVPIEYTLLFALSNPHACSNKNEYMGHGALRLSGGGHAPDAPQFGDMCIATDADDVSWQEYLYRGQWSDTLSMFWRDFSAPGPLRNRQYEPSNRGRESGCIAARIKLAPGEHGAVRFALSWSFPVFHKYWDPAPECAADDGQTGARWRNYYATLFQDSLDSAGYALRQWDRLWTETDVFRRALHCSTLPEAVIDAISANLSILKSPTCLRLTGGEFYAFEGCKSHHGSCEGSCTHVWNYAYALPFLFPNLERSMRELNYRYNQDEHGGMAFRLQLPLGAPRSSFRPCCDGQFGDVIKTYREWKLCGDDEWLRSMWEPLKKSIDYAWSKQNPDRWDPDKAGILTGRQHHTLDMELFGPNPWLSGFYVAALKAASEMAAHLGDGDAAIEYGSLYEKGRAHLNGQLWNGSYFEQRLDLRDIGVLEAFADGQVLTGGSTLDAYWNAEAGEIKYQFGEACAIDQMLAQWHANLCGLGDIFDPDKVKVALTSIFRHNFKPSLKRHYNPFRLYGFNDEAGTVIAEWPKGVYRPAVSAPYSEEVWSGCEYQFGAHLIQEGMLSEGLDVISAVRQRYDGERRNPWNEMECGSNYARSMASFSLLSAYAGFSFDMVLGEMGFDPVTTTEGGFRCAWFTGTAWGEVDIAEGRLRIDVLHGELCLSRIHTKCCAGKVELDGAPVAFARAEGALSFADKVHIRAGQSLHISEKGTD